MNQQQALKVLGLASLCSRLEVDDASQRRLSFLSKKYQTNSGDSALQTRCRTAASQVKLARKTLLRCLESEKPETLPQGESQEPAAETGTARSSKHATPPASTVHRVASESGHHLLPGRVLANRYEVRRELGRGGMGIVFSAFDRVRHELVAIKVLPSELLNDSEYRDRFLNEAKIASTLSHPHIVRVFDIHQAEGMTFLTMELLEGRSLRAEMAARVGTNKSLPIKDVLKWAGELCDALEHAHGQTVHRDVKPENIWICPDGTAKLMDFGIARALRSSRLTVTGMTLGTAYYMAPEQLSGQTEVDSRADQFALAVVLYELLSNTLPQGAVQPVYRLRRGVGRRISSAIMRALSSAREQRFESIGSFRRALIPPRRTGVKRLLLACIPLVLGLSASYPLWPNLHKMRAESARDAAKQAKEAWEEISADGAEDLNGSHLPPDAIIAAALWQTGEKQLQGIPDYARSAADFVAAAEAFGRSKQLAERFLKAYRDERLAEYRAALKHDGNLPDVLRIDDYDTAEALLQQAYEMAHSDEHSTDTTGHAAASQEYEKAVESMEQSRLRADGISKQLASWNDLQSQSQLARDQLKTWRAFRDRWKRTQTKGFDSGVQNFFLSDHERQWHQLDEQLHGQAKSAKWTELAKSAKQIGNLLQSDIARATKWLEDVELAEVRKHVDEVKGRFTAIIDELKGLLEKPEEELQVPGLRERIVSALSDSRHVDAIPQWNRMLLESSFTAGDGDHLLALEKLITLRDQIQQALQSVHQSRMQIFASWKTAAPGDKFVTIPDLAKSPLSPAIEQLKRLGLTCNTSPQQELDFTRLFVLRSNPTAGAKVERGSSVDIEIMVQIPPNLDGSPLHLVQLQLVRCGLKSWTGPVEADPDAIVESHHVDQPQPGYAALGATMSLTLKQGPGDGEKPKSGRSKGQSRLTAKRSSFVPNPPLADAMIDFVNPHGDALVVQLKDRRNPQQIIEFVVPAGKRVSQAVVRDAGGARVVTLVDANTEEPIRELGRQPVAPKPIYEVAVWELSILQLTLDKQKNIDWKNTWFSPRSIGVFTLPAGEQLQDGSQVDAYRDAKSQKNPGAVRSFPTPEMAR